ncbi:hypothetical protein HHL19_29460 [Streptomyces sp. R302]|uniref:hypothetical protein n=1 Tax=unclassified Streptomyces TaxID=2593676 RepID=UPI00145E2EAF|nr:MULTISPECIES: hypothetical protein [unclassified Streptomyces]NML55255.1 hypothetical protein [Streptomyces sp. R301]NML82675.1 hypothetical protein [Streptomyces sp. R302]
MTLTVGFRLGNDTTGRQVTVLVTETGVLHRAHGLYGRLPRVSPPVASPALAATLPALRGDNPLARRIAELRTEHAAYTRKGYTRPLIPPAVVRVDVKEHPPQDRMRHRELVHAFTDAAPTTPRSLEAAIKEFRTLLGLPTRPEGIAPAPRGRPLPPRVTAMLRTLAHGSAITPTRPRPVGWTVTGRAVRLHVGAAGEDLDRAAVLDLQAALSAWLHFTEQPKESAAAERPPSRS